MRCLGLLALVLLGASCGERHETAPRSQGPLTDAEIDTYLSVRRDVGAAEDPASLRYHLSVRRLSANDWRALERRVAAALARLPAARGPAPGDPGLEAAWRRRRELRSPGRFPGPPSDDGGPLEDEDIESYIAIMTALGEPGDKAAALNALLAEHGIARDRWEEMSSRITTAALAGLMEPLEDRPPDTLSEDTEATRPFRERIRAAIAK